MARKHDHDHEADEVEQVDAREMERDAEREARKRIALAQVRQYGDSVLRMRANEVETFGDELARLVERMTALMHDAQGVGLAATQVGVLRRVFVFDHEGEESVLVNPALTRTSSELEVDEEGCLSLGAVRVPVERPVEVTIEGKDATGADVRYELVGLPARVVQHELDHLDGVLIIDRTDPVSRKEALGRLRPRLLLASR